MVISRVGPMERPKFVTEFREIPQSYNIDDYAEAKRPVIRELPVENGSAILRRWKGALMNRRPGRNANGVCAATLEWLELMGLRPQARKVA